MGYVRVMYGLSLSLNQDQLAQGLLNNLIEGGAGKLKMMDYYAMRRVDRHHLLCLIFCCAGTRNGSGRIFSVQNGKNVF
jgi:hypothetical protein